MLKEMRPPEERLNRLKRERRRAERRVRELMALCRAARRLIKYCEEKGSGMTYFLGMLHGHLVEELGKALDEANERFWKEGGYEG